MTGVPPHVDVIVAIEEEAVINLISLTFFIDLIVRKDKIPCVKSKCKKLNELISKKKCYKNSLNKVKMTHS